MCVANWKEHAGEKNAHQNENQIAEGEREKKSRCDSHAILMAVIIFIQLNFARFVDIMDACHVYLILI